MGGDSQQLNAATLPAFRKLVKLVERELELAGEGRFAELQEAVRRTGEHLDSLPKPAPAAAQDLVLRAQALRGRVIIEVTRQAEGIASARARLRRGRRLARHYGPGRPRGYSTSA